MFTGLFILEHDVESFLMNLKLSACERHVKGWKTRKDNAKLADNWSAICRSRNQNKDAKKKKKILQAGKPYPRFRNFLVL